MGPVDHRSVVDAGAVRRNIALLVPPDRPNPPPTRPERWACCFHRLESALFRTEADHLERVGERYARAMLEAALEEEGAAANASSDSAA